MESPRQNQSFEVGALGAMGDFRDQYNIDSKGPFRLNRPKSNQQRLQGQQPDALPSMSQDRLMKFNANIDGKALLHDLDQKFEA